MFPTAKSLLASNLLLAMVAAQVFFQVWVLATGWPGVGLVLNLWISWKLGCLAGHADLAQACLLRAQVLLDHIQAKQAWFDSLPLAERVEVADDWADFLQWATKLHQREIVASQTVYENPTIRELWEWTFGQFSRRRREKKLAAAGVYTAKVRFQ